MTRKQRRIVLTGGPGSGKTACVELARRVFSRHVATLREAAGIVFGGGFPREADIASRRCAQRAIYRVQVELERLMDPRDDVLVVVCDRGTVDGAAYWPGDPAEMYRELGTTRDAEIARYDAVIHLRPPPAGNGYAQTGLRVESANEALLIDARIADAWSEHPWRFFVDSTPDFMEKITRVMAIVAEQLPADCREPPFGAARAHGSA
jgi:predicted ATPase